MDLKEMFSTFRTWNRNASSIAPHVLTAAIVALATPAFAADITWGGNYRVEAVKIQNPELSQQNFGNSNKSYMLNHLTLNPKIVAADGLVIYSRLDILNNNVTGVNPATGAIYSVAGDFLGKGPNPYDAAKPDNTVQAGQDSNAWSRTQGSGTFAITSLYASWAQEFGQLVVGRVPMQFGLGTAFNAGNGLFDHYIDTKDMIAYKIVFGNIFVMPMIGKVNEGLVGDEDDINEYVIQAQWDNPETELSIGGLYQKRIGTYGGNDTPINGNVGGGNNTNPPPGTPGRRGDGFNTTLISIFSTQKLGDFKLGLEADLLSGDTGMVAAGSGNGVSLNAYGFAAELGWNPTDRKYSALLKAGLASGDDPGTTNSYEGYAFNRNYDAGLLMFNHPLGQRDFLRTGLYRSVTTDGNTRTNVRNEIDSEAISNAVYVAPSFQYRHRDNLSFGGTVVWGLLNKEPLQGGNSARDLGYELDLNVVYKPLERLTWVTEAGILLPGEAWKGGGQFDNSITYGLVTKAAISF